MTPRETPCLDLEQIAHELEALAEKATPGPWLRSNDPKKWVSSLAPVTSQEWRDNVENDAALIIALRNNLPAILAALKAQVSAEAVQPDAQAAPVAWLYDGPSGKQQIFSSRVSSRGMLDGFSGWTEIPLYAHPPKAHSAPAVAQPGEDVVERVARVLAPHMEGGREFDQMPHDRMALRKWAREGMCNTNDATQDDALEAAQAAIAAIAVPIMKESRYDSVS